MIKNNIEELYNQGKESFVPDPSDNPENYWFYAAWKGMKAICQALEIDIDTIHHQIHHALCISHGDWSIILEDLQQQIENFIFPEMPRKRYYSDSKPEFGGEDIEKRAREIFTSQFKIAFPGKQTNSKFAQERWKEVANKAKELAKTELQETYNAWEKREEVIQQKYQKQISQWKESCSNINKIKTTIQQILDATEEKIK